MTKKKIARTKRGTKRLLGNGRTLGEILAKKVGKRDKPGDGETTVASAYFSALEEYGYAADVRAHLLRYEANRIMEMADVIAPDELTTEAAFELRRAATEIEYVAHRLTPEPETRDAMLTDALGIVEAARLIFEHEGGVDDVLSEALRSASDDFELFEAAAGSVTGGPGGMVYLRAQYRVDLALKLAEFRRKHPEWKPAKSSSDQVEQTAAVSS